MTIVFGAQNTSIIFLFNSAEPRPAQRPPSESPQSHTFWLLPLCVSDRDRLRMELLEV